ncbi:hypothetical protein AcetOrient_orf02600 [Acetobacter orientalis]|uniref:Uncharacterized protein n=1 Tax=Acetobacter orientalis TaxID=146474 RepID=A0A2Z5ZH92_9PROT|nr:hypothetical protein AcetOrient_orf02600 [Acetobacter orientalis]
MDRNLILWRFNFFIVFQILIFTYSIKIKLKIYIVNIIRNNNHINEINKFLTRNNYYIET